MAQDFLATAFVQIKPQIRGFKTELQKQLSASLAGFVAKVRVTPDLGPLRQKIISEISGAPIPIAVTPDTTGFREKIIAETKDLKVTIPVEGGTRGAAGGGSAGKEGQAKKRLATVEQAQLEVRQKLTAATNALKIAQDASLATEERSRALRLANTRLEQAFTKAIDLGTISQSKSTESLRKRVSTLSSSLETTKQELSTSKQVTTVSKEEVTAKRLLQKTEERLALARKASAAGTTPLAKAQILTSRTAAAMRVEDELLGKVLATQNPILIQAARETLALGAAQYEEASAAVTATRAQVKHAASLRGLTTGAQASSLSLLGVRGATLAAGRSFLAGAAAIAIFAKSVKLAADLEKELNVFRVTADATASEMERVSATAKQLGADITLPSVSAGDAAAAMTQLAKAGLDVEDSVDGARGVLQLATAAEIDNAEATQLVASALNAFGLAGIEATRVADLLTGSANESQGSIADMGVALQQASAAARQAGVSLEDTVALLTLLARNGIRGSDAGTSLRTAFIRLIRPTDNAQKQLGQLAIRIRDAQGRIRPEVFAELGEALNKLGARRRDRALADIFGQDAFRAASILGREGVAGLDAMRGATQEAGLAAELAGARTQGFSGQIEALKNNLETLGGTLGRRTIPFLGDTAELLNRLVTAANNAEAAVSKFEEVFGGGRGKEQTLLGDIFGDLPSSLPEAVNQLADTIKILQQGGGKKRGESLEEALVRISKESGTAAVNVDLLNSILAETELPADATKALDNLRKSIHGSSEEAQKARAQLDGLERLLISLGRRPTEVELRFFLNKGFILDSANEMRRLLAEQEIELKAKIGDSSLSGLKQQAAKSGTDSALNFVTAFGNVLTPEVGAAIGLPFFLGVQSAAKDVAPPTGGAKGLTAKQILGRVAGFDAAQVRAELRGGTAELLQTLQDEQAFLKQALQTRAAKNQIGLRRQLEKTLLQVQNEIASIQERGANDAKQRAREAAQARNDADRAAIEAFGRREEDVAGELLVAQSTESLRDDIRVNKRLRAVLKKQNKEAQTRIKDLEARRDFIRENNRKILQITLDIRKLEKDVLDQQRAEQREREEQVRESIRLDIEFGEITENRRLEIRARQRLIASFQKELNALRQLKKKTQEEKNRIKELRNETASEREAIKDLREQTKERNEEFRKLLFEQLQRQQGFAATLLSNLIPLDATTGLVGETIAPRLPRGGGPLGAPGGGIATTAAMAKAGEQGVTPGQFSQLLSIQDQMLRVLERIAGESSHPEARYQRMSSSAAMDVM